MKITMADRFGDRNGKLEKVKLSFEPDEFFPGCGGAKFLRFLEGHLATKIWGVVPAMFSIKWCELESKAL